MSCTSLQEQAEMTLELNVPTMLYSTSEGGDKCQFSTAKGCQFRLKWCAKVALHNFANHCIQEM